LSSFAGGLHVVAVVVALVVAVAVVVVLVCNCIFGLWRDSFFVAVAVVDNGGRLFLGRREIFKFGFRRFDDETLVDRRTPLSFFARLLALLAILAHAVVHQVVTSPTAIQVGTLRQAEFVGPGGSRDVLATTAESDAQLAHAQVWTKERNWLNFRSCASFYCCRKVSDIRKQQEVCCFQMFADNLCRVVCDESSAENRQEMKKERKF
jgi:hypothetical protein